MDYEAEKISRQNTENQGIEGEICDSAIPYRDPNASIREASEQDGKYLIYQPASDLALFMNRTGKRILELCDGARNVAAITKAIEQEFDVPDSIQLRPTIKGYIAALAATQLIALK